MPVLWQASQRPMYVRTVWVDGFRHAILTNDDPYLLKLQTKRRRPHSSASCVAKPKANSRLSCRSDLDCMRDFNLIVTNSRGHIETPDSELEKLDLSDIEQESVSDSETKDKDLEKEETFVNNFDMRNIRINKTGRNEKENTELSDRVLQWLDLAGKVDILAPENAERMNQPRHSWPELQRRSGNISKSKTVVDIRKSQSPKCNDNTKAQQTTCIDRREFHSSPTIENYARKSRNTKTSARCEFNPLKKTKDIKTDITETRQKVVNERTAVQKQYAELVSKKLIPDVNKNTKKQVHIFIPEMPKKTTISNNTSRTESLLSNNSIKNLNK